jgi:hypothetical protein
MSVLRVKKQELYSDIKNVNMPQWQNAPKNSKNFKNSFQTRVSFFNLKFFWGEEGI